MIKALKGYFSRPFFMFAYAAKSSFAGTLYLQQNLNYWQMQNIQS